MRVYYQWDDEGNVVTTEKETTETWGYGERIDNEPDSKDNEE